VAGPGQRPDGVAGAWSSTRRFREDDGSRRYEHHDGAACHDDHHGASSTVTMTVTVTASSAVIGTLGNDGGGYRGDLAWSVNPQNITVRSSRGGVATRAVAAK